MLSLMISTWAFIFNLIGPFFLVTRVYKTHRRRRLAINHDRNKSCHNLIPGLSIDFIILAIQSIIYNILFISIYMWPSNSLRAQHRQRYPSSPILNVSDIAFKQLSQDFVFLLAITALLLLIGNSAVTRAASIHKPVNGSRIFRLLQESILARTSAICKVTSAGLAITELIVIILATLLCVDSQTGMAFWGLFPIDAVDLLQGISNLLHVVKFWPQVVTNWENGNTVGFGSGYATCMLATAVLEMTSLLVDAVNGKGWQVIRPPGTVLYHLYVSMISGILLFQHFKVYKHANERVRQGLAKRKSFDSEEERIGLMSFS
ncbi:hypothetical protein V1514DRAFT_338188 [Lipomyces japonicus]|uniref:uncharacterized protein n=1 Tax=Lipomyces japonicus TaxID=56871 RepID=UPI0034CD893E